MSVVYRAERIDGEFEQTVAIKLLQRRLHSDDAQQRFRAERQVLASLDHPNIAQLLDGGVTDGGRPFLVLEYVDGVPLTEYADMHNLGLDARLGLLDQVFDAVRAAHRKLVVHRDLKPSNVLVTTTESGPHVQLLDFSIAKLLGDAVPVTNPQIKTSLHLMTPSYAAPEQITGGEITTETDVYQLGVLAYELFSGTRPFDLSDKSPTEVE
jgi:serine/threonine-protein kinase